MYAIRSYYAKTMRQLAVVQFFSWFALFAMWIYSTPGITASKYDMQIDTKMVNFLETEMNSFVKDYDIEQDDIDKKNEEIAKYKTILAETDSTNASVTFVSFFIGKIYNEQELNVITSYSIHYTKLYEVTSERQSPFE